MTVKEHHMTTLNWMDKTRSMNTLTDNEARTATLFAELVANKLAMPGVGVEYPATPSAYKFRNETVRTIFCQLPVRATCVDGRRVMAMCVSYPSSPGRRRHPPASAQQRPRLHHLE